MILLDTNVLLYSVGDEHPLRAPCRRTLDALRAGRLEAATTLDVLQEFTHVFARRRPRNRAISLTRLFSESLLIVEPTVDDFDHGLDLFAAHPRLQAFDAVLAAVAMEHRAVLVSADRAFAGVGGLRHVDPATPAMEELLRTGAG